MRNKNSFLALLWVISLYLFNTSCANLGETLCGDNAIDIEKFAQNITDSLDNQTMGYAWIITQDGAIVEQDSDGFARNTKDGDERMGINKRIHVGRISEHITATATLAVLADKNVGLDSSIEPFLPSDWSRGTGISELTFLELLRHRSGLDGSNTTTFDALKSIVATGVVNSKGIRYASSNYALMRVLLPKVWGELTPADSVYDDDFTAETFKAVVQQYVFDKIEVITANCKAPNSEPTLAYTSPADTASGKGGSDDFCNEVGGYGWNVSTWQLAQYLSKVAFTEDIISTENRLRMIVDEMGYRNSTAGERGRYLIQSSNWSFSGGQSYRAVIADYPNNVHLIILTNSPMANGKSLETFVTEVFDTSFGCF